MSDGKKKGLFGIALRKYRQLQKVTNFTKNKCSNDTIATNESNVSATTVNEFDASVELSDVNSFSKRDVPTSSVASSLPLDAANLENNCHSSEESPFLGFPPERELAPRLKRFSLSECEEIMKNMKLRDEIHPLRMPHKLKEKFSLNVDRSSGSQEFLDFSQSGKRKASELPMTPLLEKRKSTSTLNILIESEEILGFSSLGQEIRLTKERVCNEDARRRIKIHHGFSNSCPDLSYGILTQSPFESETAALNGEIEKLPSKGKTAEPDFDKLPGKHFYKKLFGTFNQFSNRFPQPHTQCTAMSAVALAYQTIKCVDTWDSKDLDMILIYGQKYFDLNMTEVRLNNGGIIPRGESYLDPAGLTPLLEMGEMAFTVVVHLENIYLNPYDNIANLRDAITRFESQKWGSGIITYAGFSYGFMRCARDNKCSAYTFFDSHGRDVYGNKNVTGGKKGYNSAILHFNNAEDFVSFFVEENPLRQENNVYNYNAMITLAPVTTVCFRGHNIGVQVNDIPEVVDEDQEEDGYDTDDSLLLDYDIMQWLQNQDGIFQNSPSKSHSAVPDGRNEKSTSKGKPAASNVGIEKSVSKDKAAADFKKLPGEHFYKIVFGSFDQFSAIFPEPHDQCTAMSAVALAYHTIKSVDTWNCEDLDNILLHGQIYYDLNMTDVRLNNYGEIPEGQSYLDAALLTPLLEIGEMAFTVKVHDENIVGGPHYSIATLKDAIAQFESQKWVCGIITYAAYSYGLIRRAHDNKCSAYTFFDSHGRDANGHKNVSGIKVDDKSAVLHFKNAEDFVSFFVHENPLRQEKNIYDYHVMIALTPVTIMCFKGQKLNAQVNNDIPEVVKDDDEQQEDDSSDCIIMEGDQTHTTLAEMRDSECQNQFIAYDLYENEPYYDIVVGVEIEGDYKSGSRLCISASVVALIYNNYTVVDEWTDSDLKTIFDASCSAHDECLADMKVVQEENCSQIDVFDLNRTFEFNDDDKFFIDCEGERTEAVEMHELDKVLDNFWNSCDSYGILTIGDETYAVIKTIGNRGRIAFYDIHGRREDGVKNEAPTQLLSAVIYFVHVRQMFTFLLEENEPEAVFTFYPLLVKKNITFQRVIRGSMAQNDSAFSAATRNNQCTANSVVFLAYSSLKENDWTRTDIDRILYIGDDLYAISYANAIKIRPRNNAYITAEEVWRKIVISTNGMRSGEVSVICEPVAEFSGVFGKFAHKYIERFFQKHIYGVFVGTSLSVALYRFDSTFVLFDPHARNSDGFYDSNGTANIFLFSSIGQLYGFLCREGYDPNKEFTLTAFTFREEIKNKNVPPPLPVLNLADWEVTNLRDDFDEEDDLPVINLLKSQWSPDDDIPLINFIRKKDNFTSKHLPLLHKRLTSQTLTVRSAPPAKRDGSSFEKPSRAGVVARFRNKTMNLKSKKRINMLPEEEQAVRLRWLAYLKRCARTRIPAHFQDPIQFEKAIAYHKKRMTDATDDDELIEAADAAIATTERDEERIRQRLIDRELNLTHFMAFCTHDNVDETDAIYNLLKLSAMDQVCPHCDALYFEEEKNTRGIYSGCCNNGKYFNDLPRQQSNTYPHILRQLLNGNSMLSKDFKEQILEYNNVFSFGSLGASDFRYTDPSGRLGVAVKVHGMIYHNAEYFLTNSNAPGLPPAQLYYLDKNKAADARDKLANAPLNRGLLLHIENWMYANNPYAGAYRMMAKVLDAVKMRPNPPPTSVNLQIFQVRHSEQVAIRRNHGGDFSFPTANEVAAVYTNPPEPGTKNIVIFPSDLPIENGIPIGSTDPNRDSYLYPLLFPFGEQSWSHQLYRDVINEGPNARRRVTARDFYSFLFKTRRGMFSPLLNAGKLTQQFIIDAWSRVQENQMEYMKSDQGQKKLRAETYGALKDYIENSNIFKPDMPGRVIPMPVDFVGSRKYIKEKYLDAMAVCSKYKRPTYFITLTCNPFCKDIMDNIPKGGNPVDYPEITSRVFELIVKEMVDDLKKKQVFGVCKALIYVIEWQKRTNHHSHIIVFIQEEDQPANGIDLDNVISAEIPCPVKQPRLYKAVTTLMYHEKCGPGTTALCMIPKKTGEGTVCKKDFPKKYANQSLLIDGQSPIYRRRNDGRRFTSKGGNVLDNRWIVPYNPYLLLKYDCHLNVELVSTVDVLKYLFKYFFKGLDMSRIMLEIIDGEQVYDEFQHYVDCRYLNAMEAYWRLDSFPVHYNDHVVYRLPVHLENYQRVIFDAREDVTESLTRSGSELLAYFKLNEIDVNARTYLYTNIPYHYVYDKKTKSWKPRIRDNKPLVTRLYTVNYNNIELYSLRLLLLSVKGSRSYAEIRNVRGTQHDTFHAAAVALGLLQDDDMQKRTFDEVVFVEMPYRIRCLFANLLIFITPNDPLAFWNKYKNKMCEDYVRNNNSANMAEQLALKHISTLLSAAGFTNTDMKLPEPHFDSADEQRQADIIAAEYMQNKYDRIEEEANGRCMAVLLNAEQKSFYDRVIQCVTTPNEPKLFFLDGPGGTGKTFLNRTILSTLRGMGKVCTVTVWTGMGASLYKGGRTAHSTFRLPFDITGPVACNVSTTSDIGAQLRQTDVLVWDEISMVNRHAFNAVDELFRDLMETPNEPFGGIIVITAGDFRQTLPILIRATRAELINNLVKRSNTWALFEKHALHTNMRLQNPDDVAFAAWLVDVGDGKIKDYPRNNYYDSYVKVPPECLSPSSLVESIFGERFQSRDIRQYCKYVILSTHHEDVDMLNNLIYNRMIEDIPTEKTYYSTDSISNSDIHGEELYDSTVLNNLNPKGMAPHKLVLKENAIIMLLRNLNPYDGFSNGTRLLVKKLYDNCIVGEIIAGENAGKVILIPRIRMTATVDSISKELVRIQFPVKLCFAMTIDKSQSQSFESVGIFLRKPPFSHGQLYVALSRTRFKANLKLQVYSDSLMGKLVADKTDIYVPNIVYREAL